MLPSDNSPHIGEVSNKAAQHGIRPQGRTIEPCSGAAPSFDRSDRGYRPEVLYDPSTDQLLAIWTWRGKAASSGAVSPYVIVYSYRPASGGDWLPMIDGDIQEPPLALFAATRRVAARSQRLAWNGHGTAYAAWIEIERDESIEVYVGAFDPASLLTRKEE